MTRIPNIRAPQPPANVVRDEAVRRAYLKRHWLCQICLLPANGVHHLIGGAGRSDEPCNMLALCWFPCHRRCEGDRVIYKNEILEPIPLAEQLAIKRRDDPDEWDPERLAVLYGKALPEG